MIEVICIRPTHLRGRPVPVGQRLPLLPLDAAALIDGGKAELVNASDLQRLRDAVAADVKQSCRMPPGPTGPAGYLLGGVPAGR